MNGPVMRYQGYDPDSIKLSEWRVIFLTGSINDESASKIIMALLQFDYESGEDISLYINSPGGVVTSTLAIYDTMQFVRSRVKTYCIGQAASGAALLLAAGAKGYRYILPHARTMIHQPLIQGGLGGQTTDLVIQVGEIARLRKSLVELFAEITGHPAEDVERHMERDFYQTAEASVEYGLVDHVIRPTEFVGQTNP
jgi:ATP-dependent Clp protease protease subunit